MEAGLTDHVWTLEEVALQLEAKNMEARQAKRCLRGPYQKRLSAWDESPLPVCHESE